MDVAAIFTILQKGLQVLPTLVDAGMSIAGLVEKMSAVAEKGKNGEVVSAQELADLEADLDAKLAEFNAPLPPEG